MENQITECIGNHDEFFTEAMAEVYPGKGGGCLWRNIDEGGTQNFEESQIYFLSTTTLRWANPVHERIRAEPIRASKRTRKGLAKGYRQ